MTDDRRPAWSPVRFAVWFTAGAVVAGFALWSQLGSVDGDLGFVLRVGTDSGTREFIEGELGSLPLTEGLGHDGQYSYLIARDPLGLNGLPDLADDGAYRFRRALYGWLAGGFGALPPRTALIGLALWTIVGFGLATAALADLTGLLGARLWAVVGVLGNLGLWLSVQLATADALAMGLALMAVVLAVRRRTGWAVAALVAAVLTKDSYLLFAVGLGGWLFFEGERRAAVRAVLIPAGVLALWVGWLSWQVGNGLSAKANFALPLVGLAESFTEWESPGDLVQALVALVALAGATLVAAVTRHRLLVWLIVPWVLVAVVSSSVVWGDGNNAVRAFAPLWLLAWVGAGWWVQARSTPGQGNTSRRNLPV